MEAAKRNLKCPPRASKRRRIHNIAYPFYPSLRHAFKFKESMMKRQKIDKNQLPEEIGGIDLDSANRSIAKSHEDVTSISDLPEDILVHIISFLPLKETVKTSVLAQSWRNLWLSVPVLSFDMYDFQVKITKKCDLKIIAKEKSLKICEHFCEFISNTLSNRPQHDLSLQKFKLRCRDDQKTLEYIDSWLKLLIPAKVVELDLDFFPKEAKISTLFFQQSAEVLKLSGIEFVFPKEALRLRLE